VGQRRAGTPAVAAVEGRNTKYNSSRLCYEYYVNN
jgi:hypothetical protein